MVDLTSTTAPRVEPASEPTSEHCVLVYTRFNRLWHWSQMASIMILIFTGLRITGFHTLIPFPLAVMLHSLVAIALLLLWAFATFWLFTTGNWRQYLPKGAGLWEVARFYAFGVFRGEHHPYRKVFLRKHNPLQALAYLALKTALFPAIWSTGIIYLLHPLWGSLNPNGFWLSLVANMHVLAGFAIAAFVVAHIYLLTIGHGFRSHVRPMITGFDRINLTAAEEAFLRQDDPGRLRPPESCPS